MNKNLPISQTIIFEAIEKSSAKNLETASIREVVAILNAVKEQSGVEFLRMDMGVPGLPTPEIGKQAIKDAIDQDLTCIYAQIDGLSELKTEISRFAKNFIGIDVSPRACLVTAGSMMASMITFMFVAKRYPDRQGILFFDPGFAVQKKQAMAAQVPAFSFDVTNYRGKALKEKLSEVCRQHPISTIIYSNPNNPTWICLTEEELKAIGEVANEQDIVIAEDLAYFGMDFRYDYSKPGVPPFQPSVAKYTNNYVILFSSSKVFSFAGERVGALLVSDYLFHQSYPNLLKFGDNEHLGYALVQDGIYSISAGVSHTSQYGLYALLKAANDGEFNFLKYVHEYADRAKFMKFLFLKYGFKIVYDKDGESDLADGFYFTINHPALTTDKLMLLLMQCGISTVSLSIMGAPRDSGCRISVSMIDRQHYNELEERLQLFTSLLPHP